MSAAKKLPPVRGARRRIRPEDLITRGMIPRSRAVNDNMPEPANDNPLRVPKSDIGRKSRAIGARVARLSPAIKALEVATGLPAYMPGKWAPRIPGGWYQRSQCQGSRPPTHWAVRDQAQFCGALQALPGASPVTGDPKSGEPILVTPPDVAWVTFGKATHYNADGSFSRGVLADSFKRLGGWPAESVAWSFARQPAYAPHLNPWANPNVERATPTLPDPVADPLPEPDPWPDPDSKAVEIVFHRSGQVSMQAVRPSLRRPPRNRKERHKKRFGKKSLGEWVFYALDGVSEMAEVVDAIYESLPQGLRDDVESNLWRDKSPLDAFGQYGIDGNDWKIPVIIDNWDLIDMNEALKGIVKNQLEDTVIGLKEWMRPRNTVNAMDDADLKFAKLVDEMLTEIGFD